MGWRSRVSSLSLGVFLVGVRVRVSNPIPNPNPNPNPNPTLEAVEGRVQLVRVVLLRGLGQQQHRAPQPAVEPVLELRAHVGREDARRRAPHARRARLRAVAGRHHLAQVAARARGEEGHRAREVLRRGRGRE